MGYIIYTLAMPQEMAIVIGWILITIYLAALVLSLVKLFKQEGRSLDKWLILAALIFIPVLGMLAFWILHYLKRSNLAG